MESIYFTFVNLPKSTKLSIAGLLQMIASVDERNFTKAKANLVDQHIKGLGLTVYECNEHIKKYGGIGTLDQIKNLSLPQRDMLIALTHNLVSVDGRPTQTDLQIISNSFNYIGISDEYFVNTVSKLNTIINGYSK
ncbi:MAG: hypothetical protein DI539_13890 [Flavobacterium psychrophilum]|nr:MAG: hypothetical protein DI539_13890 [Flavobacterium psychrophilum]